MRTNILKIMLLAVMMAASCTTNNGDIGPWFGTWRVNELQCDGVAQPDYQGNLFIKFQNTVVQLVLTGDNHTAANSYGTWQDHGEGTMTLTFADEKRLPMPDSHFTAGTNAVTYAWHGGDVVTFTVTQPDGHTYTYRMQKW
ncbi:MAG: hypothetical protein ACI308_02915 [Muribaculaceae bacterium]